MRINHNIAALNTYSRLNQASESQSKSLEKLSSGLRINKAGDDAAGLAISEKMRGQIRGLSQASRNAQDSISLIQTAEGALNETHSILQRMRELSVQASNDTNTTVDRGEIQKEVNQLVGEIDRIGNTTEFNTKKLLNGSANIGAALGGASPTLISNVTGSGDTQVNAVVTISVSAVATQDSFTISAAALATTATAFTAATTINVNGTNFSFTTANTAQDMIDTVNNAKVGATMTFTGAGSFSVKSDTYGSAAAMTSTTAANGSVVTVSAMTQGVDAQITGFSGAGMTSYAAKGNHITVTGGTATGMEFDLDKTTGIAAATTVTVNSNGTLSMQIGANAGQTMNIGISDMRSAALGVNSIDVSSATNASAAVTTVNNAIASVSSERSKLGAYQNRLEHTINNLDTSAENLQASESRIRDVDMAKEMMDFTKNNILSQAATAMLAQANQQPQGVLQLLR